MAEKRADLDLDFSHSPTIYRLLHDDSFVVGIKGPVGSGKSYGCASRIMVRALQQKPAKDNVRYTRWAVVRNSYPELKTTTLKTWTDLFPEHQWGRINHTPPITHHIRMPTRGKIPGVDCEVIFLALDQPKDVRKLLSLELTGAWVNEARELPKAVIDGLTHRVGRYPPKRDGGPTWRGVWMDTNPMDDDHWWFKLAEAREQHGRFRWKFYDQPPAVFEVAAPEGEADRAGCVFAAGKWWRVNPEAENLDNLPSGYYEQLLANKKIDWIRCYAEGKYVFVQDGRPVWPEYDDHVMVGTPELVRGLPLQLGLDFGLTPAAVMGQKLPDGRWQILFELPMFDMGLERFGQALLGELALNAPGTEIVAWGDPAGEQRDAIYETTAFQYLASIGIKARPTPTNDPNTRREAGAMPMGRMVAGRPGLVVHERCKWLRKALAGGYHFKRVQVAGRETFRDTANKNEYSHIGDAYGYLMLGGGEHRQLTRNAALSKGFAAGPVVAKLDFDVFAS